MKILGLCHDVVICSACVVVDGDVAVAIPEERLDRVKQSRGFPGMAVDRCLRQLGLSIEDMDEIAVGWNPAIELETIPDGYANCRRWRTEHLSQVPGQFIRANLQKASPELSITGLWKDCPPITFVDHYWAHVGSSFMLSPFESAAILILDGRGEKQTALLAAGRGASVEILSEVVFPHSLGLFFGAITQFLGFKPDSDEWKVMALASYADWDNPYYPLLSRMVEVHGNGGFELDLGFFEFYNFWDRRMFSDKLVKVLGPPRTRGAELSARHEQIAAALQKVFEEKVSEILIRLHERTGLDKLVIGGGCFMNSVFNGKVTELTPFEECFVSSCPDDSGTSVGAALLLHVQRTGLRRISGQSHNFWGQDFSDDHCAQLVRRYKLPQAEQVSDPAEAAARDIAAGKLVGWFQGRSEFGQRALGNRSILADPRTAEMKDLINRAVKYRENFRPFAPAVLAESVSDYFECSRDLRVPFMERVLKFRADVRDKVPAVVHVDGTGRLQTVDSESCPTFHRVIRNFHKLTGVPLVLNTSFNLNGQPIVDSPDDAIRTFYSCGLDVLYLAKTRISK